MGRQTAAESFFQEGLAFLQMRDHLAQAEACFRQGLAAEPGHAGCLLQLGITLRVLGRVKEAARVLDQARSAAPAEPLVLINQARVLQAQRQPAEALARYDEALALAPGHLEARIRRIAALDDLHAWAQALAACEALIAELPPAEAELHGLPVRREDYRSRVALLAESGADPAWPAQERALALYRRANQLVLEDRIDEAVRAYGCAARLEPDYADPRFPIGATVATQAARHPDGAYPSCRWIEEGLHFHDFRLGFCCTAHHGSKGWAAVGPFHGGPLPIDFLLARRIQLIRQNQAGVDNECRGCHELERRPWPAGPGLVGQMILNNYSICNMKCTYCSLAIAHFEMPPYYYLAEPAIDSLITNGWLAPGAQVTWGGGEPGVSREFQAITSKLLAAGCRFSINTNATRIVPAIEEALRQGRCELAISVDSGTPETFYRIKFNSDHPVQNAGRPAFNGVWETIARYAGLSRDSVAVKYIFMPTNIGEADIRGFVDRCLAHGVGQVMLTPEFSDVSTGSVAPEVWAAIARTRALAEANGLKVLFNPLDPSNPSMPAGL